MIDRLDQNHCPSLLEIGEYVGGPLFSQFCEEVMGRYQCAERIEFSACSMEKGWNVKFKKSGKALCTVYPREGYFTAMVVVGRKEKEPVEAILPNCDSRLRELYAQTREGNGQRWLMIDLEDRDEVYRDVLRLIEIRRKPLMKRRRCHGTLGNSEIRRPPLCLGG